MQLIDGWKSVLAGSWSVRFAALSTLFGSLAAATAPGGQISAMFPALESVLGLESGTLAAIAALFGAVAVVVRVIPQPKLQDKMAVEVVTTAIAEVTKADMKAGAELVMESMRSNGPITKERATAAILDALRGNNGR